GVEALPRGLRFRGIETQGDVVNTGPGRFLHTTCSPPIRLQLTWHERCRRHRNEWEGTSGCLASRPDFCIDAVRRARRIREGQGAAAHRTVIGLNARV